MNSNKLENGYCTLDKKDDTTQRYWYKCNKDPFATITIKVCGVGQNEADQLAEQAMEDLKNPPKDNYISLGCKDDPTIKK